MSDTPEPATGTRPTAWAGLLGAVDQDQGSAIAGPPRGRPAEAVTPPPRPPVLSADGKRGELSGREWAGYQVGDLIGRGGMGEVYLAVQLSLARVVALKVLPAGMAEDAERRARFAAEVRAAARLRSPQVVAVFDSGEHAGRLWLAMEHVAGRSLAEELHTRRLAGRRFAPIEALELARLAALGLAVAHAERLVHRDIKPGNLLLDGGGGLKIADFGLVRFLDAAALTLTGATLGTPQYMSPEQCRGQAVDARSDLYSLGAVLYELLTLRPPFAGETAEALTFQHNFVEPELPTAINPDLPQDLQAVCLKCLQKAPDQRFSDATALVTDLERVRDGLAPVSAVFAPGQLDTGAKEALRRLAGWRRRWWPVLAGAAALALAIAGGWWWWDARKAETAQVRERLAPLARAAPAPATAGDDLARLAALAGGDDPQVRQGRARLAELAALHAGLDRLAARADEPATRAEAEGLLARLAAASGGGDPRLAAWRTRLEALAAEQAALRAQLAELDRADPASVAQRAAAAPRLARLALLAGADDAECVRWRTALERGAGEEAALRERLARLDDPAPLTAAALAELAAGQARLLAMRPPQPPPASWAARLDGDRARLDALATRLAAALAAPPADDAATAAAAQAADELRGLQALAAADEGRLEARRTGQRARAAAAAAVRTALADRLAALDAPRSLAPGIERDLAEYERLAGLADPAGQRWRRRLAEVRRLQTRLEPLARPAPPPAGAAADLDALARLVGTDDAGVAAARAKLAAVAARRAALAAGLDARQPVPAGIDAELDALARLVGEEDADLRRWRARVAAWRAAAAVLDPLAAAWVLDPAGLAGARAALAAARAMAGDAAPVAAWARRLDELDPAPPAWAAAHGRDHHGAWIQLRVEGQEQRLRWLPPATDRLGSPLDEDGRDADETPFTVTRTRGLWIAERECSQAFFQAVTGGNPARHRGDPALPVEQVARAQAEAFCRRLAELAPGCAARLPDEVEWEAAARAGQDGPRPGLRPDLAAAALVHAASGPVPVDQGPVNAIGLQHTLGNVWEWCRGAYGLRPGGERVVDPPPLSGDDAVARGGSYADPLAACRVANRVRLDPGVRSPCLGFRFVAEP